MKRSLSYQVVRDRITEYGFTSSPIRGPETAARHFEERGREWDREMFYALLLNTKNRIIAEELVAIGSLNAALVHPRELFRAAVTKGAAGIIILHNHPGGDPEPSLEDRELTVRMAKCGDLLGIEMVDHIVIAYTPSGFAFKSLREMGVMDCLGSYRQREQQWAPSGPTAREQAFEEPRKVRELSQWEVVFEEAKAAGEAAGAAVTPNPMVVVDSDLSGAPLPGGNKYYCSEGLCGFAWVWFKCTTPQNRRFYHDLKRSGKLGDINSRAEWTPNYGGGYQYWVSCGNQSVERKEAYAYAMAKVLRDAGLQVHVGSRLD